MSDINQNALVKFDFESLEPKYHSKYPFAEKDVFVYQGEVHQMPGHCIVTRISDGRVFINYHTENFIELTEEEC